MFGDHLSLANLWVKMAKLHELMGQDAASRLAIRNASYHIEEAAKLQHQTVRFNREGGDVICSSTKIACA
jgi:hypothetical protein